MSSSPQASAAAASDAYNNRSQSDIGTKFPPLDGQKYEVFGYKDDPVTGFHATAYQNLATGEIIIAYRGTDPDFKKHPGTMLQDIAVDATMVRDAINPQKDEADAFTAAMIAKAAQQGISKDHVSVAGHSLGGTLAQIEAAKFGLRGATLNAFGAVGMTDGPPAPGCQLTNYRMAGDPVSAANAHIGTVVSLASPEDVVGLQAGRYLDAPAGSAPPNPLIAMRGGDHSGAHFTGADGNINVLNPAVMAEYAQRYKDHQAAFDHLSGDLNRERGELSVTLRQMESGKPSVHLPSDIQQQLNEYLAINADPIIRDKIEHNATVQRVEHRLQHGADGVRAGSQFVQTQDEQVATAARKAGEFMLPLAPLAPLAGAALGEAAHLHGQAVHAVGNYAAHKLESARQTVKQSAHNVSQTAQAAIHNPEVQATTVGVVNRIVDTYGRVEATGRAVEQSYDTATHPMQSLERALASEISAEMSAALDATRHQQRALHGESSQADRTQEAQRQQQIQGHIATREAPLPPTPAAILPGLRVPEREPAPAPSPGSYNHDAQTSAPTRTEPAIATIEPSHAALAAQQTHQQAMHAQQQARPQEERAASPSRDTTSLEPGRVAEAAALVPAAVSSPREVAPVLTPPLDPLALRDFRHAEHPLNPRYQMFRDALGEQGFHEARPTLNEAPAVRGYSAEQKDRLAAGFTARLGSDLLYNTEIQHFRKDGEALLAIEHPRDLGDRPLVLAVPEAQTLAHTPEQHAAAWRTRELPPPEAVNTQRPDPHSLSPDHPGHPDHSHHPLFEHARAALTHEYARWGMQKGAESLDRETVQVMIGARDMQMNDVGAVRLLKNGLEGRISENPHLAVFATPEGPYQRFQDKAIVLSQTLQEAPSVAQSAVQFKEVDQAMTQQQLTNQALQAQIHAQGQQGPMLGVGR
ncbi:hypothetical protein ACPPVV_02050 [Rhodanobacter sp. Col0626]|uniref:hypothetical protein n=1 Tax=Rhodanobacter sp. Col0626 TaxID=3415679 RepID=UPI003CEA16E2